MQNHRVETASRIEPTGAIRTCLELWLCRGTGRQMHGRSLWLGSTSLLRTLPLLRLILLAPVMVALQAPPPLNSCRLLLRLASAKTLGVLTRPMLRSQRLLSSEKRAAVLARSRGLLSVAMMTGVLPVSPRLHSPVSVLHSPVSVLHAGRGLSWKLLVVFSEHEGFVTLLTLGWLGCVFC
jgi:hypothetical protein